MKKVAKKDSKANIVQGDKYVRLVSLFLPAAVCKIDAFAQKYVHA